MARLTAFLDRVDAGLDCVQVSLLGRFDKFINLHLVVLLGRLELSRLRPYSRLGASGRVIAVWREQGSRLRGELL